jgi:2-C-methyl-D-erythritol 4-phosphate cytidylyltransferase
VVAGGSGRRFGAAKQFAILAGSERVIDRSVSVARSISAGVVVVLPATDLAEVGADPLGQPPVLVVAGGDSRAASVQAGLAAVPESVEVICVHDGARPFADNDLYQRVLAGLETAEIAAVVPGVAVADTIKRVVRDQTGTRVVDTPARDSLVAVQTPQVFRAEILREAHMRFGSDASVTDDAMMVERLGHVVAVVDGSITNRKITLVEDLDWAREHVERMP